jgi:hypothetical protein
MNFSQAIDYCGAIISQDFKILSNFFTQRMLRKSLYLILFVINGFKNNSIFIRKFGSLRTSD